MLRLWPFRVVPLVVLLWQAPAHTAEGLYLTWGDCAVTGGRSLETSACDTDIGSSSLFCGLVMPAATDSVLGIEVVVDIQYSSATLPDWWRFGSGGCREGLLAADTDFGGLSTCLDFWQGRVAGGMQSYTLGMLRGDQARIRLAFGVPSNHPRSLDATDMYYAARIVLSNDRTLACPGCSGGTCLVLNSVLVKRPPRPEGAPTTDVLVTTPGNGNGNWAIWQPGGANCQAVPVRNVTWGRLKALYR
jgi:hypothetical protein